MGLAACRPTGITNQFQQNVGRSDPAFAVGLKKVNEKMMQDPKADLKCI